MRIALFGPTYPFRGGISHFNTCLYKCLAQKHAVRLYSYCYQYPAWLYPGENADEQDDTFKVAEADRTMHSLKPWTWVRTARRMAKDGQDLCLFPWWSIFWWPHYRVMLPIIKHFNKKTKIIFYCHNIVDHETADWKIKLTLNLFKRADGFICHSRQNSDYLTARWPAAKIGVTPHPSYHQFGATDLSKKQARQKLGLPEDCSSMLFFGYVRQYKGLDLLLRIMPLLISKIPKLHLLIAGEFLDDRRNYDALIDAATKEHVHIFDRYIGNDQVPIYFKAADVCVLPYRRATGSGIAQLSLAQGVPLIGTRSGSLAEVIEPGVNGYLVPPDDEQALARAIVDYFADVNPLRLAAGARQTAAKYSWDRAEEAIVKLYQSL